MYATTRLDRTRSDTRVGRRKAARRTHVSVYRKRNAFYCADIVAIKTRRKRARNTPVKYANVNTEYRGPATTNAQHIFMENMKKIPTINRIRDTSIFILYRRYQSISVDTGKKILVHTTSVGGGFFSFQRRP